MVKSPGGTFYGYLYMRLTKKNNTKMTQIYEIYEGASGMITQLSPHSPEKTPKYS